MGRRARRFEFQKRSQFVIGVSNEMPSIVAVRVSNSDYRTSVAAGADPGLLKATNPRSVYLFKFWIFAYPVHRGSG